jgi:hypothetical protein
MRLFAGSEGVEERISVLTETLPISLSLPAISGVPSLKMEIGILSVH